MSEDASLDDFLGGESGEQSGAGEDAASADGAEATDAATPADATDGPTADIEPATATYAWSGEGVACEECGESVKRRWQQAGRLVCIDCKDWERA
ncbi:DUF7573 domain-containing protein [Haloarcula sediminis]|uniref:DUF7573 domain-containing protein n=1 Tax=Haloarcula sediminis TaxID=3111777 RepID=UPI002D78FC63|nr:hypothetical protein [Haloarcula sp. CK38]